MIHQLSCVHPGAIIGNNVTIGPFVTIDDNVVIGDDTVIDSNATIHWGTRIGRNCHIHSGAAVGGTPQDLKFKGEETLAIIGDNTTIREFVTIHRGTASKGKTVVGSDCLIMAYCHIAHDCNIGNHVIMSNSAQIAGEVIVGDWAVIGGGALIHQFSLIGQHSMLQGGSLVNKDVPPFSLAGRIPLSYEGVNSVGMLRRGFSRDQVNEVQEIYRTLYMSNLNVTDAVNKIEAELPQSDLRDAVITFIRSSKRGIVRHGI